MQVGRPGTVTRMVQEPDGLARISISDPVEVTPMLTGASLYFFARAFSSASRGAHCGPWAR